MNEESANVERQCKLTRLVAPLLCLVMLAAGCSSDGADDEVEEGTESEQSQDQTTEPEASDDEPAATPTTNTLIWATTQEPGDLHFDDPTNNLPVTSWIRSPLIEGLYGIDSTTSFYPELLAEDGRVTADDDGTITVAYTLRDDLRWSDGTPLTSADVEYTHNILTEGCESEADGSIVDGGDIGCVYYDGDRTGIDLVTGFNVESETDFTITLASFFAGWRGLYDEVYAAHAYGEDAAAVNENLAEWENLDGVLPSSGPMIFESWERGVSLRMVPNPDYHGSTSPDATNTGPSSLDAVQIDFVADTDGQTGALLEGQAHVIMAAPTPDLGRLTVSDDVAVAASAGPGYEHLGFNVLNPHLAKPEVREAIAYALDKGQIMREVYEPLFGTTLPADGLGNAYWMTNQPAYEDHQSKYDGAQSDSAKTALESAGYSLGAGEVYTHPIDGRLSLRIGTTGGNDLRERQQQWIQEQLAAAGIELIIDNVDGGAYFVEQPFSDAALAAATTAGAEGDPTIWDITMFGRVGGPWPGGQSASFRGSNPNNPYGFTNPEFDVRASECDVIFDDGERADCYNELDSFVTTLDKGDSGLVIIPLTQKPSFFAHRNELADAGVAPDVLGGGPLANVADYRFAQ